MPAFDRSLIPAEPDLAFEMELWQAGHTAIAGVDEAGRGALAGPVAAAVVILPPEIEAMKVLRGVRDSKQMTPEQRESARDKIMRFSRCWGVGFASSAEIDQLGILPATRLAVNRALASLCVVPTHILLDYLQIPELSTPQTSLVKGDCRSLSIAAASVLAKTSRDALLRKLEHVYPGYGFARHKGYGTLAHRDAILRLGPCPEHRLSFTLLADEDIALEESS